MHFPRILIALPVSLLLALLGDKTTAQATEGDNLPSKWTHNRPLQDKYSPEDPPRRRQDLEVIQEHVISGRTPVSVKKMSTDESEKFFPEFWGFDEHDNQFAILNSTGMSSARNVLRTKNIDEGIKLAANGLNQISFRPAFALHEAQESPFKPDQAAGTVTRIKRSNGISAAALALLESRAFQCPSGTSPCSNIAPNLCCAQGEICFTIPDSGLGTVGCCPNGATCAGNITCAAGDTPCNSKIGGGCCISGYVCADMGCVVQVTIVSSVTQTISSSSVIVVTTSTSSTPATSSSSNPAPSPTTVTTSTTATASAPVRRTSGSGSLIAATSATSTSTVTEGPCPTGFYACSAYYSGGCCRTGRDCATTNCPPAASTTLISSGVTIVVPLTGDATTTASGVCPTAWYGCEANLGGSCCPNGWTCGVESCTSVGATGTASNPKQGIVQGAGNRSHSDSRWITRVVIFLVLGIVFIQ